MKKLEVAYGGKRYVPAVPAASLMRKAVEAARKAAAQAAVAASAASTPRAARKKSPRRSSPRDSPRAKSRGNSPRRAAAAAGAAAAGSSGATAKKEEEAAVGAEDSQLADASTVADVVKEEKDVAAVGADGTTDGNAQPVAQAKDAAAAAPAPVITVPTAVEATADGAGEASGGEDTDKASTATRKKGLGRRSGNLPVGGGTGLVRLVGSHCMWTNTHTPLLLHRLIHSVCCIRYHYHHYCQCDLKATLRVFFPRKNASQVKELFEALVRDPAIRRGERVNYRQLFDETPEGDQVRQPQAHTNSCIVQQPMMLFPVTRLTHASFGVGWAG